MFRSCRRAANLLAFAFCLSLVEWLAKVRSGRRRASGALAIHATPPQAALAASPSIHDPVHPMRKTLPTCCLTFLIACLTLAGCASTQPTAYAGLASASQLKANPDDTSGHIPYRISTRTDWHPYTSAIVAPVVVYKGPDAQFEDISDEEKVTLAHYMNDQFKQALKKRFDIVDSPAAHTVLVKVTLTGARTTTRFLSTATRFDLVGAPYNIVQSIRGKEGSFTGSVSYAVEIFDATSLVLLDAYVTKQYPNALNVSASLGKMDASMTGVQKGAEALVERLN